jgi:hypothetical protein
VGTAAVKVAVGAAAVAVGAIEVAVETTGMGVTVGVSVGNGVGEGTGIRVLVGDGMAGRAVGVGAGTTAVAEAADVPWTVGEGLEAVGAASQAASARIDKARKARKNGLLMKWVQFTFRSFVAVVPLR